MSEPLDPKEVVGIEEMAISDMYEIEALIEGLRIDPHLARLWRGVK